MKQRTIPPAERARATDTQEENVSVHEQPGFVGHRQRLRQRFVKTGLDGFADYEVVELLLTLAIPRADVKPHAKELIKRFGTLRGILDAPIDDLRKINGIGEVTPIALQIIKAAAALYLRQSAEAADVVSGVEALEQHWRLSIGSLTSEVFEIACLDTGRRLLRNSVERLEEGTVDRAAIYPRRVAEAALKRGAAAVLLAHNHPNGHVEPTDHDKLVTRAIVLACDAIGVRVLDHLVVSRDEAFSFRKAGLL